MTSEQAFIHRYEAGAPSLPPLLLLHAEDDNEMQLLSLAHAIEPQAPVLAVRGKIVAQPGKARFSLPPPSGEPGGASADDIAERAAELAGFLAELCKQHKLRAPVAVGHSNGAYMALALLLRHAGTLAGAALLRPDATVASAAAPRLERTPVLLVSGAHDDEAAKSVRHALRRALQTSGAELDEVELAAKRRLCGEDSRVTAAWFRRRFH